MIDRKDIRFQKILGGYEPSQVQVGICDFIEHGIGNASVESRAGSGKSKTIELGVQFVPEGKKTLVLSYNVHIAQHLKEKLKSKDRKIDVLTYHSLGLKILQSKHKDITIDDNKYIQYIFSNINKLNEGFSDFSSVNKATYIRNVQKLLDYSRYNLMQSVKEINKMALKYGVRTFSNECEAVRKIMKWGSENIDVIDYTDMVWLPYELGITGGIPYLSYDMIFIDEAQDSSLAQQNIINICMKRNTRFILFGDSRQCVNSWAGADEDAFTTFNKRPNVKQFKLNVSYRCAKKIAERAREIVPDFETPEDAIEGSVNYNVPLSEIKPGDMVLCRLTSPLVKLYIKFVDEGKPVYVKGIDIGRKLKEYYATYQAKDLKELKTALIKNIIKQWDNCAEMYHTDLKSVVGESEVMVAYDEYLTLNTLSEGISDMNELNDRIDNLFIKRSKDVNIDDKNVIHLSTVHRAKGLESDNVFILCPSLMPNKMARRDWEVKAEQNILYVATTRAKKTLNYISEKEFPPEKSYSGNNELYNEFKTLRDSINDDN